IMKKIAAPLYRLEREAQQDAIAARAHWESEREILQARKQAIVKKLNRLKDDYGKKTLADADADEEQVWGEAQAELEEISAELARIGEFPEPGMIAGDSTPEALVDLMAEQKNGVAVLAAEAAPIDNMFGRYSDQPGNSNLNAVCEAYTADPIRVGRRGRPKVVISRPLLTITLFAQEDVLEKVAAHGKARTQGFIGRFALVDASVTSYVGHRQISPPPAKTPAHLHEAWDTVVRRAQTLLSATQPTKTPSEADSGVSVDSVALSEVTISTLTLSPTSKKLLTEIELATEPRLRAGADLEFFRDWMSRHHGRVARVAALLHLAEGRSPEEPIAIDVMGRAARIGEYLFAHALRVVSSPDPLMRRAKAWLAEQLAAGAGEVAGQIISQRELHRGVLGAHGPSTEAAELAARLVEHGALRPASAPAPKDPLGRGHHPSPRFEINPHLRAR
ncbi:MAG: DUF3987 domain-containing protein, partial [Gaiellaceae bacterium]